MNKEREQEGLHSLGHKSEYKMDYAPEVLETFINKHQENDYWVRLIVLNSQASVLLQASRTLLKSVSATSLT